MKRTKRLRRALLALLLLGAIVYGALFAAMLAGDRTRGDGGGRTVVILGCQVYPWGPSVLLKDRLDTALAYLDDHPDATVIVTGGKGDDEVQSEADCMRDYLVAHGVDASRILAEDRSSNTHENAVFTVRLMEENGLPVEDGVAIVSNGFHLTRAALLWKRSAGSAPAELIAAPSTHLPSRVLMYLREPLALAKSIVFDR